jgi:hypothetical protein
MDNSAQNESPQISIGKSVYTKTYFHVTCIELVRQQFRHLAQTAAAKAGLDVGKQFNVVRIDQNLTQVALLSYPDFFDNPYPELGESWLVRCDHWTVSHRTYEHSTNPPILHRKELLLPTDHPRAAEYSAFTKIAEDIGLFDNTTLIGFRKAWWLEDPMQNLYNREPLPLARWVTLRSDINYRSPREILHTVNQLLPLDRPMESGSPLSGHDVEFLTYVDTRDLISKTVAGITECIKDGFKRQHVSLITFRGRESSRLAPFEAIGPYTLRAPTSQYDLFGNPVFTQGDIVTDSVHRFKGRASPCVVFTEIDFEAMDDNVMRRLFVGVTRATMKLVLVMSENAAKALLARLPD